MRKLLATSLFTVALMLGIYSACAAQSKTTTDFSGKWELDKSRTSDLPPSLESYTMTVTQDAEQLAIETDLQGDLGMRGRPGRSGRQGDRRGGAGGLPGGSGQGGGFPGGREPSDGPGGGGFSLPKDAIMGMALRMAPPKAIYTLDGKETWQEVEERESGRRPQPGGSIAFKADWKKGGKTLELQSNRKFETPEGERSVTNKDRWELSEDGNTLTVQRSIDMPMGVEEVKLVFAKQ